MRARFKERLDADVESGIEASFLAGLEAVRVF